MRKHFALPMNTTDRFQRRFDSRLAKASSSEATSGDMIFVAWAYLHGEGVGRNADKAVDWLTRAAEMGSQEAQVRLAELYELGDAVPRDCGMAEYWYKKAEQAGGFWAPYVRAVSYLFGSECVRVDLKEALEHFSIAARRGHLVSEFQVAKLLRSGQFGFLRRSLGYALTMKALFSCWWIILRRDESDRLWDAQRWIGEGKLIDRLRRGTRFE